MWLLTAAMINLNALNFFTAKTLRHKRSNTKTKVKEFFVYLCSASDFVAKYYRLNNWIDQSYEAT